ncbi:hypothetical protein A9798_12315 [Edwardsiella hoshinae]|uniref:P fimbrial regulatory protein KS71A n=1 Tax=Edwardsiella hoshinae TaxID=93378 RepID=A0A1D8MWG3_9GAMM|nr:FaeA/PapI family transcriptional regulator [Edwardsiella hoshinae]AOV96340.1 hypothetical protein A9798_04855 [Edwardsiella hoshinae]AOV97655.1 hypothetical protein A9798_12315 [Edwardsiella hoshinae]QPR27780.1 hypothetical protein I6G97_15430 [Edwardsiella hoshinae]QPR29445.1 hypothetical protein I6G97_07730 [Edwardsiella hoshinae]STC86016.1 P fimbrial regulatory protein KS71A [Edwardsiella hoshinae]
MKKTDSIEIKKAILAYMAAHHTVRTACVAEAMKLTDYQARHHLQQLEIAGKVKRTPLQRGVKTCWQINAVSAVGGKK